MLNILLWVAVAVAFAATGGSGWVLLAGVVVFAIGWVPLKFHVLGAQLNQRAVEGPVSHDPAMGAIDAMRDEMIGVIRGVERSLRADIDQRGPSGPIADAPNPTMSIVGTVIASRLDPIKTHLIVEFGDAGSSTTIELASAIRSIDADGMVVSIIPDTNTRLLTLDDLPKSGVGDLVNIIDGVSADPRAIITAAIDGAVAALSIGVIDVGSAVDRALDAADAMVPRLRHDGLLILLNTPTGGDTTFVEQLSDRHGGTTLDLPHAPHGGGIALWQPNA